MGLQATAACLLNKWRKAWHFISEAEYTFKKKKPFIPCRLEFRYDPDDWLGIMIGNRLYFDFSREEKFEQSIQGLIREIGKRGKGPPQVIVPRELQHFFSENKSSAL